MYLREGLDMVAGVSIIGGGWGHICESLKPRYSPAEFSRALKDYHDKTHYAAMADFYHRYYFYCATSYIRPLLRGIEHKI